MHTVPSADPDAGSPRLAAPRRRHSTWKWILGIGALAVALPLGALIATAPSEDLVLETSKLAEGPGDRVVSASFRNRSEDVAYARLQLDVELLDFRDSVVGVVRAEGRNVQPGDEVTLRATIPRPAREVPRVRLARLHCMGAGAGRAGPCTLGAPVTLPPR